MYSENIYTSSGELIDNSIFSDENYIDGGIQGRVYHYGSDKVIKVLMSDGTAYKYDMVSTIKNLNLPNFSKIYDILSKEKGPVKSYSGTICKFYERNVIDIWTQPSEYIIDSFLGICDVATILGRNKIAIGDLTPINTFLSNDGIIVIDFDSFYNVYGGYSDRIIDDNLYEVKSVLFLPLLFSQFVMFHDDCYDRKDLVSCVSDLLQSDNSSDTRTFVKRLSKYKYPIDYFKYHFK